MLHDIIYRYIERERGRFNSIGILHYTTLQCNILIYYIMLYVLLYVIPARSQKRRAEGPAAPPHRGRRYGEVPAARYRYRHRSRHTDVATIVDMEIDRYLENRHHLARWRLQGHSRARASTRRAIRANAGIPWSEVTTFGAPRRTRNGALDVLSLLMSNLLAAPNEVFLAVAVAKKRYHMCTITCAPLQQPCVLRRIGPCMDRSDTKT